MLEKEGWGLHLELTTPEKFSMSVIVKPEELFSYDTTTSIFD